MNPNHKKGITSRQFFYMFIQFQIGVGVLSLPHTTYMVAEKNAWLLIVVLGIVIQCITTISGSIGRQFPKQSFFEYVSALTGPFVTKIITALFALYFLLVGGLIASYFGKIMKAWVLPHTPLWFIHFLLIGTAVYIARKGIQNIGYFLLFLFPCILLFLVLLSFSWIDMPFFDPLPFSPVQLSSIFHSSKEYILAFSGFEAFPFFYPYIQGIAKQKLKSALFANLFTQIYYVYIVLITLFRLAPSQIQTIAEPLLFVLRTLPISAFFRIDLVFLSIWMICITTSILLYVYLASHSLSCLFHLKQKKRKTYLLLGTAFLLYMISLLLQNDVVAHILTQCCLSLCIFMTIFLPLVLFLLSYIKRKRRK